MRAEDYPLDEIEDFLHDLFTSERSIENLRTQNDKQDYCSSSPQAKAIFSEHQLIQALSLAGYFKRDDSSLDTPASAQLALFHKHFIVMHCLYRLQRRFFEHEHSFLNISALEIYLEHCDVIAHAGQSLSSSHTNHALRTYYLDCNNLDQATASSVESLIASFWKKFEQHTQLSDQALEHALAVFNLSLPLESELLTISYRKKLQQCHPDKGGDVADFIKAKEAYALISDYLERNNPC